MLPMENPMNVAGTDCPGEPTVMAPPVLSVVPLLTAMLTVAVAEPLLLLAVRV